jgi:hypothetical protein
LRSRKGGDILDQLCNYQFIRIKYVNQSLNIFRIKIAHPYCFKKSRDSSVGIALGYGLDEPRVRFPAGAGNFSLHHRVQNGSGVHPDSYPMGTMGSFPGGKAEGE